MTDRLIDSPRAPMRVARHIADDRYQREGLRTLVHHRGSFLRWDGPQWVEVEENELRAALYGVLDGASFLDAKGEEQPWNPNRRSVSDVADALRALSHLPEHVGAPGWMPTAPTVLTRHQPGEIVSVTNGLLDVRTRDLLEHTPNFFTQVSVPFDYHPDAATPREWLRFLHSVWGEDVQAIAALQQWFGYILSGRTDQQKILLLVGPTRSGKGTIARVLAALLGRRNVAGPTLASLATNFGLAPLLGKPLALVSDARLGGSDVHQVVERLLSISGEDLLTVDRKFREPWSGKLPARFMILSNELPRFGDASGAISNRMIVLTMRRSFLGSEDTGLTGRLLAELPGILTWALEGLDRLHRHGEFTMPASSLESALLLQDLVSPTAAFIRERCVRHTAARVRTDDLWSAWTAWCRDTGRHPGTRQKFGADLQSAAPEVTRHRYRSAGGQRVYDYLGIALRADIDTDDDDDPVRASNAQTSGTSGTAPQSASSEAVLSVPSPGTVSGTADDPVPNAVPNRNADNRRSEAVSPTVPGISALSALTGMCHVCGEPMSLRTDRESGRHESCAHPPREHPRKVKAATVRKPRRCAECTIELPAAQTGDRCEECADGPPRATEQAPKQRRTVPVYSENLRVNRDRAVGHRGGAVRP